MLPPLPPPAPPSPPVPPPSPPGPPAPPVTTMSDVTLGLIFFGVFGTVPLLTICACVMWCFCRPDAAQRRLMRGTRASKAAALAEVVRASPAEAVMGRVVGKLEPAAAHLLSALTGRKCVWYRASCFRSRRSGKRTVTDCLASEEAGVDGVVDDGSGAPVSLALGQLLERGEDAYRIDSEAGAASPDHSDTGRWPLCFREFLLRADHWEEEHSERAIDVWQRAGTSWFVEEVLLAGETVAVWGFFERAVADADGTATLRVTGAGRDEAYEEHRTRAGLGALSWWLRCALRLDFLRLGGRVLVSDVQAASAAPRHDVPPVLVPAVGRSLSLSRSGELVDAVGLPADYYGAGDEALLVGRGSTRGAAFGPLPIAAPAALRTE